MMPLTLQPSDVTNGMIQLFHGMFVIGAILYLIFALLVLRQIDLMKKTLITPFSPVVTTLGLVHLAAAVMMLWVFSVGL